MEMGVGPIVPFDVLYLIERELGPDLLARQAFALTCKAAYTVCGKLSDGIIGLLPEKWRNFRTHDPYRHYYYPLLYRILREAPSWLYDWEIDACKKVHTGLPMVLSVSLHRRRQRGRPFASYTVENNGRGWSFDSSSGGIAYKVFTGKAMFLDTDKQ
jgi:hypothetical protein